MFAKEDTTKFTTFYLNPDPPSGFELGTPGFPMLLGRLSLSSFWGRLNEYPEFLGN